MDNNYESYTERTSNPFCASEVVDISSDDHTFTKPVRGLIITASGNVVFHLLGDASGTNMTLPVLVATGHHFELRSYIIDAVIKTGTTATVYKGLL